MNKKILLIGGAGFIGHHLALHFRKNKDEVHIVDSLKVNNFLQIAMNGNDLYLKFLKDRLDLMRNAKVNFHFIDARNYHKLSKVVKETEPNIIIHLAAVAHAGISNKDPYSTFDHSLQTLENSLDTCIHLKPHFIYFSSSMVYGNFRTDKLSEYAELDPIGIYGNLKLAGERMVIAYNQTFDLPYTIVRPSALYGERCISRRVIQVFIEKIINNEEIEIQGDGSNRLDFTYINDLVNWIDHIVKMRSSINQVFNVTYGQSRTINDVLSILLGENKHIEIRYKEWDKLVPKRGTLSVDKGIRLLGYRPQWPLEKGILEYMRWYKCQIK